MTGQATQHAMDLPGKRQGAKKLGKAGERSFAPKMGREGQMKNSEPAQFGMVWMKVPSIKIDAAFITS